LLLPKLEGEDIIRMVARRRPKLDSCKEGEDIRMASRRGPKDGFKEKKDIRMVARKEET
jgi:hypothetical protein